jgi:general L-amino acid transport system permease protein
MAVRTEGRTTTGAVSAPRGAWWNDANVRAVLYQILTVLVIVAIGWYLISNTLNNLAQRNIATGFGFLDREAGLPIGEHLIAYTPASSYGRAYLVGMLNTIFVSALGIVFATILGTIVGVARLSSNWLVAKLASFYVELIRNIPLLLQLFVWYGILLTLPPARQSLNPVPGVFLSQRGLYFPVLYEHPVYFVMLILFALGIVATFLVSRWGKQRQALTGKPFPMLGPALGLIFGLPLIAWLIAGAPFQVNAPELKGFNFQGGSSVTPEFVALLLGLVTYTAAFIAETVRAGILAVPKGQWEAARALGMPEGRILRLIVLPQALRVIVPPTTSQYLNLTKNSSLAVGIAYPDLVSVGNTIINQTGQAVEGIAMIMAVYLTLSLLIAAFMNWYNKRIALKER